MGIKPRYLLLLCGIIFTAVVLFVVRGGMSSVVSLNRQPGAAFAFSAGFAVAVALALWVSKRRAAFIREQERKRIAADLHDEIGAGLALLKFQVDGFRCEDPATEADRQKAMEGLDDLCLKLRNITRSLTSQVASHLIKNVADLVAKLKDATGIPILFHYKLKTHLTEEQSLHCFRVIQETLNNALKHGEASEIFLNIYEEDHNLNITCRDNGKGFDYKTAITQSKGMGLGNIAWRMRRLKGKFLVDSRPGGGSAFRYEISLG